MSSKRRGKKLDDEGPAIGTSGSDDDDFNDAASMVSSISSESSELAENWEDDFVQAIEDVKDKKRETRERALNVLKQTMSRRFVRDALERRTETLVNNLVTCLRRGDNKEGAEAARALAMLIINAGDGELISADEDSLGEATMRTLNDIAFKASSGPDMKAATVECLCFWHFMLTHSHDMQQAMNDIYDKFLAQPKAKPSEDENKFISAALRGWGLMASSLSVLARTHLLYRVLHDFNTYLNSDSLEVRLAAGEDLALLYESMHQMEDEEHRHQLTDEDHEIQDSIKDMLGTLSTDYSKSRSKKERAVQRSLFREILATVESGEAPEEKLRIGDQHIYFSSWESLLQLYRFRELLGHGIVHHFKDNELVRDIFDLSHINFDVQRAKLSKHEKRAMFAETAAYKKERTIDRAKITRAFSRDLLSSAEDYGGGSDEGDGDYA